MNTPRALADAILAHLDQMERRAEAALLPPWESSLDSVYSIGSKETVCFNNEGGGWSFDFIAAAREDVPAATAALRVLVAAIMRPRPLPWELTLIKGGFVANPRGSDFVLVYNETQTGWSVNQKTKHGTRPLLRFDDQYGLDARAAAEQWAVDNGAWPDIAPALLAAAQALGIDLGASKKPPDHSGG